MVLPVDSIIATNSRSFIVEGVFGIAADLARWPDVPVGTKAGEGGMLLIEQTCSERQYLH
jgi:hypothetical protein